MARNSVPAGVIFAYYANLVPQVFLDVTPFALMIAVLIVLTLLERQQEMTALKAAGISLYRLTVPVLLVAAVSAAGLWEPRGAKTARPDKGSGNDPYLPSQRPPVAPFAGRRVAL
jgi:hypothetical protein